ncbi:MAG: hypothetical protein ABIX01_00180 [Chitinophagaceae bacterium]
MQKKLFSDVEKPIKKSTSLVIKTAGKAALSKNQEAFNKLTTRIAKLHRELERKNAQFDEAIRVYTTAIHPLQTQIATCKREELGLVWEVYQSKKLGKADQRNLKKMLSGMLHEVIQEVAKPDDELKEIFRELEGETYESVIRREKETIRDEMQEMFESMNINIDREDFDLDDKAFAEKMAEAQQKINEKFEREQQEYQNKRRRSKKTLKQLDREQQQQLVDEMKQKNISTIYRQLAKLFHPDLEQDEERRVEKEVLMKQLTAAYEAKNLHELLTLELKWIHKENDHLAQLTEEKLLIYLQILREQAQQLEKEKYTLPYKPQYSVLFAAYGQAIGSQPLPFVKNELQHLQLYLQAFKNDLLVLRSENSMKQVKRMIKVWRATNEFNMEGIADFLEDFKGSELPF